LASVASPAAPPAPASPGIPAGGIVGRVFTNPGLTVTGGSLYLRRSLSPARQDPPRMELARVDAATGAIVATSTFSPGAIGAPLAAAGSLWLTGSFSGHAMLLRLDSRTLMVTGELTIAPVNSGAERSHIAYAGGSIWVDGSDELVRVSPATVAAELTIPLPGADTSDIGGSPDGGTLIVSEADSGDGTIQRRDPVTGALLASHSMLGVIAPLIGGGVSAAGAWVSEPTGMLGYIERFSAASLTPGAYPGQRRQRPARGRLGRGAVGQEPGGGPRAELLRRPGDGTQARDASAARPGPGLPDGGHGRPDLLLGARQQRIRDPHSSGPGRLRVA
ncbi:MAG TPA: hypothetical protein VFE59_13715, partial [Trebonia sp.]|nr:hypothetical protein [Trebonia sp.]